MRLERLRRHGLHHRHAPNSLVLSLVIAEEEGAILVDRPAESAAELVFDRIRNVNFAVRTTSQLEVVTRFEGAVVVEFKEAAVKVVRAGPRGDVDHRPDRAPELCVVVRGRNAELLNRFGGRNLHHQPEQRFVVVHAVDLEVVGRIVLAVDLQKLRALWVVEDADLRIGRDDARHQRHQRLKVAPVQRQFGDFLGLERLADIGAFCLQYRRRRADLNRLGDASYFERRVDTQRRAGA